jgi:ATP-dependent Lon protease
MDIIRGEMFSSGYGFVVDYLAEILRAFRNRDFSNLYGEYFTLSKEISTRDRDAVNKTFSGLMKILYPEGTATSEEIEELLKFAIEGRKRIKDQLLRIDSTYTTVNFSYANKEGKQTAITTLEEEQYPQNYYQIVKEDETNLTPEAPSGSKEPETKEILTPMASNEKAPTERHVTVHENQRGVSFDSLFGSYLQGATKILITDPYIRLFYQVRNLMEFLETVAKHKKDDEEVEVRLITCKDDMKGDQQIENLEKIEASAATVGIRFTWAFDTSGSIHARHIITDTGWKILLDRGLDVFQHYEMNEAFAFSNRLQKYRPCKAFEVTFIKADIESLKKGEVAVKVEAR